MLRVWDKAAKERSSALAHDGPISSVVYSVEARMVYTAGDDGTVKAWNWEDASLENSIESHAKGVSALDVSPDGRLLASGGVDGVVKLWNAHTGAPIAAFPAHTKAVRSIAFGPDGTAFATGGADRLIQVWRASGALLGTIVGHDEAVAWLGWVGPNLLLSAATDGTMKLWRTADLVEVARRRAHDRSLAAMAAIRPDRIATAGGDGKLKLWRIAGMQIAEASSLSLDRNATCLAWSRDGAVLAAGMADRSIRYWSAQDASALARAPGHEAAVTSISFGPE
jgi:WD40 repeat protein